MENLSAAAAAAAGEGRDGPTAEVRVLCSAGLFLLILGAWIAIRPYGGIWHDAILYTGQALHRLYPEILGHDVFFAPGSPGDFTVFPAFYAQVIRWLGVDAAAQWLVVGGRLLWFVGLAYVVGGFLRDRALWLGLALAVALSPFYGPFRMFSYGEPFITSRLFAEALVLLAIGFCVRGRGVSSGATLLLAGALHPLMAIPGIAVLTAWLLLGARRPWRLLLPMACGGLAVVLLAWAGVRPFDRLFIRYDAQWLAVVYYRNAQVFLGNWNGPAFVRIGVVALLLIVTARYSDGRLRRLAKALLVALALLLAAAWVGADLLHSVLMTQLQLWRVLWLVQLLAMACLGGMVVSAWKGGTNERLLVFFLGCALLVDMSLIGLVAAAGASCFGLAQLPMPAWLRPRALFVFVFGMLVLTLGLQFLWVRHLMEERAAGAGPAWVPVLFDPIVLGICAVLAHEALRRSVRGVYVVLPLGVVAAAAGVWSFIATNPRPPPPDQAVIADLRVLIPPRATVFKVNDVAYDWFWLHRAHYISGDEMSGVSLSRTLALQGWARLERLWSVGLEDGNPFPRNEARRVLPSLQVLPEPQAVRILCADPSLGYLIVQDPDAPAEGAVAGPPLPYIYQKHGIRLYDCAKVRALALPSVAAPPVPMPPALQPTIPASRG